MAREIRHQYDDKKVKVTLDCSKEPSQTKQSFAKECDVNEILKRYKKTGLPPDLREGGKYGDFSSAPDYQSAMNTVIRANELFAALPAKARLEFGNDPATFLAFMDDPKNAEKAIELGLAIDTRGPNPPIGVGPKAAAAASGAVDQSAQALDGSAPVAGAK